MSQPVQSAALRPAEPARRAAADRRADDRMAVVLLGRFMRESKHEYPCKMVDFSADGAALMAPVEMEIGEKVIAYFDQLGGLEGKVVRNFAGGFAISFTMTTHKRDKLAATKAFMRGKQLNPGIEARRHERIGLTSQVQKLTLSEGLTIDCEVFDMSISGASVITPARPELGSVIKLGNLNVRIVRHHDRGVGVEFVDVQNPNALRRYFG